MHHRSSLFFFNHTPPTEIYTLSLHDALPILLRLRAGVSANASRPVRSSTASTVGWARRASRPKEAPTRSEEHTSELQSRRDLVCRLLLEKKKKKYKKLYHRH